ncbi:uncharacterized protein LOC111882826 [Lactuca sativa]|uniref:uncharacterized protein LOC111882826 n=1 Tax=Lactuca sativa TaxID=4236 RepID=UPI0022B0320B|nr:uncharacterized protein LOC111882826 [Lactuca sativa]
MGFLGFGEKWRVWIRSMCSNARSSVLINGSLTDEFQLFRGLRQRDLISPFLFIIAMEGLHIAIEDAAVEGVFQGAPMGSDEVLVSHLFYVNDAIFLGEWDATHIQNLIRILRCFYLVSDLNLNLTISNLYGVGINPAEIASLASFTRCSDGTLPFVYLGILAGKSMVQLKGWQIIIDRFKKRLSSWKVKLLSIGGRLTLIKSVLRSLGIYFFSLFRLLATICHSLEALRARFFWGVDEGQNRIHWVNWNLILNSYAQ